jgi:O-methyltransferase
LWRLQLELTERSVTIVYFDCDLYRTGFEILEVLERDHILQDGTVVMGDDRNINQANPAFGQRRALAEFLERHQNCDAASPHLNYWFSSSPLILHNTAVPRRSRQGLRPCRF